jgi:beta-N-acetylhexosaminidase
VSRAYPAKEAGQTLGPLLIGLGGTEISTEEAGWLCHPAVGGVVLFTRNYRDVSQLTRYCASIIEISGRDLLICVDHEGGRVQRFREGFTRLPPLALLGKMYAESSSNALDFAYRHGRVMATELLLTGVDLSFAPVLDLGARSVVIGDRAFSQDKEIIIELSTAYIAGMHDAGMAATGKHFPGHGSVVADSHTDDVCDPRPFEEIEQADLKPFAALSGKLEAMMMAHVLYPAVHDRPAGYSPFWINTILRQKLGYRGTIFSDDLGMYAARVAGGLLERVRDSLRAGCDAVLVCHPEDVRGLLADIKGSPLNASWADESWPDADPALRRLKGRITATRDEIESVSEWRQWKKSITQLELEQSKWV